MNPNLAYFKSKSFKKNLGIAIGITVLVLILLRLYLQIYTHHGRSRTVPDLSNRTLEEVKTELKKSRLRFEIFDSLYIAGKLPGVVVDQQPKPGQLVKKDRIIYITTNARGPEKTVMTSFIGVTIREARSRISSMGLSIGELSYRYHLTKNVILEQSFNGKPLVAGDTLFKGSAIDFVLGKGLGDESSLVPNMIGLSIAEAKIKITDAFFSIGVILPDGSLDNLQIDFETDTLSRVFKQRPAHDIGAMLPLGSSIDLYVTIDSARFSTEELADSIYYE